MLPDGVDVAHVRKRLKLLRRPNVTITDPPTGVVFERDVEVVVRDGTVLRVNVFRPEAGGPFPVLLCAHPYGKNGLPKPKPKGGGYKTPFQLRMLPQSEPFSFSAWTSWESPDPAFWVPRGYVIVNCDLRGWGTSDGVGEILSEQEARDGHDLVEWAAAQPWSNGKVGMLGVSYLAISQWTTASARPPHLAAIAPWEGFTDGYRDFMRPGGVLEQGFLRMWEFGLRRQKRSPVRVFKEAKKRPVFDDWWAARNRDIEAIDVPILACATFSDHNLHSRGTFEGFRRASSTPKWLYAHRGPKWSTFYSSPDAQAAQTQFFDHFLRGDDNGMPTLPRARIEVREDGSTVSAVRHYDDWPAPGTTWEPLALVAAGALVDTPPESERRVTFDLPRGRATFTYRFERDIEIVGPMRVRLHLSLAGTNDMCVFAGVRKLRNDKIVGFEGSYGFDRALVTFGMAKASHRAVDPERSQPWLPFHPNTSAQPLRHGEIVALDIELPPSATLFRAGETLRLDIQGRWFFPTNPIVGQMPARYERSKRGKCTLYCGGPYDAQLLVPRVPTA